MGTYYDDLVARAEEIRLEHNIVKSGGQRPGMIPTGIRELDRRGGTKRKIASLYGGDSGFGKSFLAIQFARNAAMAGHKVAYFSLEDPKERTADRDFSHITGINNAKMMNYELSDREVEQIQLAKKKMKWAKNIALLTGLTSAEDCLEQLTDEKWDLVIVDYLSAFPHGKHGRERSIGDFCWGATAYAQKRFEDDELGAAVVFLAQVNKTVSQRGMAAKTEYDRAKRFRQEEEPGDGLPYIEGFRPFDYTDLAWCTDAGRIAKEHGYIFYPGELYRRFKVKPSLYDDSIREFSFPKRNFGKSGIITVKFDPTTATYTDMPVKGKG